jgi:hypothetical protein
MDAKELFKQSVQVMKKLFGEEEMLNSIKRARERSDTENLALLVKEREKINELIRALAEASGSKEALEGISRNCRDALILRYFRNRDMFVKTFPDGIEHVAQDPVSLWAALMVSPLDEEPS